MDKKLTEELKQALEAFKNMPETDKLKLVNRYLALENRMLKQQLEWRQKADFANWWNKVKDIPLM